MRVTKRNRGVIGYRVSVLPTAQPRQMARQPEVRIACSQINLGSRIPRGHPGSVELVRQHRLGCMALEHDVLSLEGLQEWNSRRGMRALRLVAGLRLAWSFCCSTVAPANLAALDFSFIKPAGVHPFRVYWVF